MNINDAEKVLNLNEILQKRKAQLRMLKRHRDWNGEVPKTVIANIKYYSDADIEIPYEQVIEYLISQITILENQIIAMGFDLPENLE